MTGMTATARWLIHARAAETMRADRLFVDRFAVAFLEAQEPDLLAAFRERPTTRFDVLAVRTSFFDALLAEAVAGEIRQVVILAAGYDSRGLRLDWPPGVRLYELDLPDVVADKEARLRDYGLTARCERRTVGVDLRGEWPAALTAAGFDPGAPAVWLVEGFLYYLTVQEADELLDRLTALSAPGSRLGLEHVNEDVYRAPWMRRWLRDMEAEGRPWRSGVAEPEKWLAGRGWSATVREPCELEIARSRVIPATPPRPAPGAARTWLVNAVRTRANDMSDVGSTAGDA